MTIISLTTHQDEQSNIECKNLEIDFSKIVFDKSIIGKDRLPINKAEKEENPIKKAIQQWGTITTTTGANTVMVDDQTIEYLNGTSTKMLNLMKKALGERNSLEQVLLHGQGGTFLEKPYSGIWRFNPPASPSKETYESTDFFTVVDFFESMSFRTNLSTYWDNDVIYKSIFEQDKNFDEGFASSLIPISIVFNIINNSWDSPLLAGTNTNDWFKYGYQDKEEDNIKYTDKSLRLIYDNVNNFFINYKLEIEWGFSNTSFTLRKSMEPGLSQIIGREHIDIFNAESMFVKVLSNDGKFYFGEIRDFIVNYKPLVPNK